MSKFFSVFAPILLLNFFFGNGYPASRFNYAPVFPAGENLVKDAPPENIAWIAGFSDKLEKNSRGFWEAEFRFGIRMVYIPAGEFLMGSPESEDGREADEGPLHRVRLAGIWIGKFEVTAKQWHDLMGGSVSSQEAELPVSGVSYRDIEKFIAALRGKAGLEFRLPTEAEWERCCRGGNASARYGPLDKIGWYAGNSGGRAHPVGLKQPNEFGIYDMLGNVWEWCRDWYSASCYKSSPLENPAGPGQGERRVCRGGGFAHRPSYLRAAHRNDQDPKKSKPYLGFRLALDSALQ